MMLVLELKTIGDYFVYYISNYYLFQVQISASSSSLNPLYIILPCIGVVVLAGAIAGAAIVKRRYSAGIHVFIYCVNCINILLFNRIGLLLNVT